MKSKYAKYHQIRKLNGHLNLEATKLAFRVNDTSIPRRNTSYGWKKKTELPDFK